MQPTQEVTKSNAPQINASELTARLKECYLFVNLANPKETVVVDFKRCEVRKEAEESLKRVFGKGFDEWAKDHLIYAHFEYHPHKPCTYLNHNNETVYNRYVPPAWKREYFFNGTPIPKQDELPPVYLRFFQHLTDQKQESFEYLLQWCAEGLRGRSQTHLTLIGPQGVGKTIFGELSTAVHGPENSYQGSDAMFRGEFNAEVANRTFIHCDEFDLRKPEHERKMKLLAGNRIEVHRKYADRETQPNYASLYLSANDPKALNLSPDDRRYSLIHVTDKPLRTFGDTGAIIAELMQPDNVQALARHLYHLSLTRNMSVPFKDAEKVQEIVLAVANDWEIWAIEELPLKYQGQSFGVAELKEIIRVGAGLDHGPGRPKLDALFERHPNLFKVKKSGSDREYTVLPTEQNVSKTCNLVWDSLSNYGFDELTFNVSACGANNPPETVGRSLLLLQDRGVLEVKGRQGTVWSLKLLKQYPKDSGQASAVIDGLQKSESAAVVTTDPYAGGL